MRLPTLAILALGSLPFLTSAIPVISATPAATPTVWYPDTNCIPATITASSQLVTSVQTGIKTTSFHATSSGVYTPPYQTSVWTVDEPTWVTYEVPCATAYIMPYSAITCPTCTIDVIIIIFVDIDITAYSHEVWSPSGTSTVSATTTPTIDYTPTYGAPSPAKTHFVKVGGLAGNVTGGTPVLRYDPEYIDGEVGDVVEFLFLANNHTVTQADFASPCVPKYGGFNSGFMPNKANILGAVSTTFTIKDTSPAWFYCAQTAGPKPHCQSGMVFSINAAKTGDKTFEDFQKLAFNVPFVAPSSSVSSAVVTTSYGAPPVYDYSAATTTSYYAPPPVYTSYSSVATSYYVSSPVYSSYSSAATSYYVPPPVYTTYSSATTSYYAPPPVYSSYSAVDAASYYVPPPVYTPYSAATTTSAYAASVTHYVTVGGLVPGNPKPILRYNPEYVNAELGDVVQFNFLAANHTVTQSSFDTPCMAIPGGFKTGVQMNPKNINGLILKEFVVTSTNPLWFYCGVPGHCQQGMVFAINPYGKFPEFQAKAIASPPTATTSIFLGPGPVIIPHTTSSVYAVTTAGAYEDLPADTYYPAATTTASSYAASVTHYVTVGGLVPGNPKPILRYNPEYVNAELGDVVQFNFLAANHTVTQSSFDTPCMAIPGGFKTGVQMNPKNINGLILKEFVVTSTNPLWFYCGVPGHCQQGMVFAINPYGKFPAFQAKAIASPPTATTSIFLGPGPVSIPHTTTPTPYAAPPSYTPYYAATTSTTSAVVTATYGY